MKPQVITEEEIAALVSFDNESIKAIEGAFASLADGSEVLMPPVMQINVDAVHGQTCIKSAYTAGIPYFVIKVASTFHENHKISIPNSSGLMLVCSSETGRVESILLDNGYLTALRTQAAGAVAAKYLACEDARVAGLIGAGRQARLQLRALTAVRPITRAIVWSHDSSASEQFAAEMSTQLGIEVVVGNSAEETVRPADIIVTATPATAPIVRAEWLSPGQHITAMGADAPGKSELFPEVLKKATSYVCDHEEQCRKLSELHMAISAGVIDRDFPVTELARIVVGKALGRHTKDDITVADLTGLGVQDAAIALLAWSKIYSG